MSSISLFSLKPHPDAIIHIYPGNSTHPKVVFREVLHPIELEFGTVDFREEGKTREPGEKPLGAE